MSLKVLSMWFGSHVLWIVSYDITIFFSSATSRSKLSKGGVFFFFHFCSKIFLTYKASVEEGQLCLVLGNAFVFVQYSKMFPHFARYTPFVAFCNGEYNFKVREFLSKFFIFLAPFLLVFINSNFWVFFTITINTNKLLPILSTMIMTFLK